MPRFHQLGGKLLLQRHVVIVGGVDELRELVLQRGHQPGMAVAQGVHGNAAQRVEVFHCC